MRVVVARAVVSLENTRVSAQKNEEMSAHPGAAVALFSLKERELEKRSVAWVPIPALSWTFCIMS